MLQSYCMSFSGQLLKRGFGCISGELTDQTRATCVLDALATVLHRMHPHHSSALESIWM
jgi:hypothetical protein